MTTEDTTDSDRCNEEVHPRWIDYHFPDYWLIRKFGHFRRLVRGTKLGWIDKALARYSLRHVHCSSGECVLRAGHRGCCTWGYDEEDEG